MRGLFVSILDYIEDATTVLMGLLIGLFLAIILLAVVLTALIFRRKKTWDNLCREIKGRWQKRRLQFYEKVAIEFMLKAVHMGGKPEDCISVTTKLLKLAKFRAKPVLGRVGGLSPCSFFVYEGRDADSVKNWIKELVKSVFLSGHFEDEVDRIINAIVARRNS